MYIYSVNYTKEKKYYLSKKQFILNSLDNRTPRAMRAFVLAKYTNIQYKKH